MDYRDLHKNNLRMEFCERLYNSTNSSSRELVSGIANITHDQYMHMCVNNRKANFFGVSRLIIIPYVLTFLLSVVGNSLVIMTLVRHKKMRTVTNMFLLNLAVSDLLLALFCMPFTLVPLVMLDFIFGPVVCVLFRYAQAVSVGVSCATLVAISMERFYAICQPLKSRRWQTLKHSYKVIIGIWLSVAALMVPIAVFNREVNLNNGAVACREIWPNHVVESVYTIILDMILLVVPLLVMAFSYGRIAKALWTKISISSSIEPGSPLSESDLYGKEKQTDYTASLHDSPLIPRRHIAPTVPTESTNGKYQLRVLRPAYNCRVLANKKRVVKMLFVIVLEYFICWSPLYIIISWTVVDYNSAKDHISLLLKSLLLLLAYISSCIHPITYCFMNKRFRQSFADAFRCCFRKKLSSNVLYSEASHGNGTSDVPSARSSSTLFKMTWRRQT